MADDITAYDDIEGYCGRLSYRPGQLATLHTSTRHASYDVAVHRWGADRELVWEATGLPGAERPIPADADANGCRWPVSVEIPIGDGWRSGFYLVTMTVGERATDPTRATAHACFVVGGHPERRASMLFLLGTNTWNAYNTWGGRSLYTGGTQVSFRRPFGRGMLARPEVDRDDRKARPTRWGESPDIDGDRFQAYRHGAGYPAAIGSTGWFSHERRFVEWAERAGWRFDYAVSSDLDEDPTILDGVEVLVDVGHDEYWSAAERDVVERHVERGGHWASMSGNTMFWQVRLEPAAPADGPASGGPAADGPDPTAVMVCHKYGAHQTDPVVAAGRPEAMSGLWCDPLVGRPEWSVLGAASAWGLYNRFGWATPRGSGAFTVYRHDHWLLAGTDLRYGDLLGADDGVVGYETVGCRIDLDEYQLPVARPHPGLPDDIEIVALTPSSNLGMGEYPASISALSDQGDLEFLAERLFGRVDEDALARVRYGNSVVSVCRPFGPSGGEVVVIGTTDWVFGLARDPAVGTVTANICRRYLGVPPGGHDRSRVPAQ